MNKFLNFETDRLRLVPTLERDAAFIYELVNSPKWMEYIGDRKVHSEADARVYISTRMRPQLEKFYFGNYTVIRKKDDQKLGSCGIYIREGLADPDIGFAFLPQYEGKGYAFESASKILHAAEHIFKLKTIRAITLLENKSSQKLLEKLGMSFTGMVNISDDPVELMQYVKKLN